MRYGRPVGGYKPVSDEAGLYLLQVNDLQEVRIMGKKGLIDKILDEQWSGRHGEKLTAREIQFARVFGKRGKTLKNVYIPKENGETTEIDVIYITQKGIFVFESKNYSGRIYGDERSRYWMCVLPNGGKNRFYSPVLQNNGHIKWLRRFLGEDIPMFSVVVFSNRCSLKKVTVESLDIKVIKREQIYSAVREIWKGNPDMLSDSQVDELYEKLKPLADVDEAVKKAHVETIRKKYS